MKNGEGKRCSVEGCQKPTRTKSADLCKMHYHRLYRNGTLERVRKPKPFHFHSNGYVIAYLPGHPLVKGKRPYEFQHRISFYNEHGDGPFTCHWCDREVTWGDMHVDHLDENKLNNEVENLAASCVHCNMNRHRFERFLRIRDCHIAFKSLARDPMRFDFRPREDGYLPPLYQSRQRRMG